MVAHSAITPWNGGINVSLSCQGGGTPIAETTCRNILYFMKMTSDKLFYLFNQEENIINNKTGFIVSENVEEITNILEKLIKDKEFYNKINKNIIEAKININFDKELKKLEEL